MLRPAKYDVVTSKNLNGNYVSAETIIRAMEKSILQKCVTYDFARLMEGAMQVPCSGFGQVLIEIM